MRRELGVPLRDVPRGTRSSQACANPARRSPVSAPGFSSAMAHPPRGRDGARPLRALRRGGLRESPRSSSSLRDSSPRRAAPRAGRRPPCPRRGVYGGRISPLSSPRCRERGHQVEVLGVIASIFDAENETGILYCFKPPFPSGGGCAAASAGRSGPVGTSPEPQSRQLDSSIGVHSFWVHSAHPKEDRFGGRNLSGASIGASRRPLGARPSQL